ncbi:DNA-3-methyladenine glycosylase family protein [Pelomicrobium methylotrophicum]|uniref:DNA-3-methyladenine glycosylase II n=1 Tax=Pelomicrobium methylotrophicum TaxID=2602750 RepID=A0A5C7EKV2_9PROT|nr:DNA-3-methyladenine glycosylase [Pelomicrobium methylotrophicum]TXF11702.1 DNA-3-methyladenine glycosylase 2 family protein [Pelomicrobium methylotrophicum]
MTPLYWEQAKRELAGLDPVLRQLIRRYDGPALRRRSDAFTALARSIVGQQISVKAAESVWQRLAAACGGVSPEALLELDEAQLRACGLSARKADYLTELARRFSDGSLSLQAWERLDDEALIAELTRLRGIGRWTAEMFLIFYMLRPDVLPLDDLGLQRAMSMHYNNDRPLSKLKMRSIAKRWVPWRSVATWYLWRSLDPIPVEY